MAERHLAGCDWVGICGFLALFPLLGFVVFEIVFLATSRGPAYLVTIAGVAGLDPAADLSSARPALSPAFNLTFRIGNARNRLSTKCISGLSTVAVMYDSEILGRGVMPQFCAKETKVRLCGATARGQDLAVPRFLRDQLAGELVVGEAYVDIKVTTPADCYQCSDTVLVCSKAKIGGGPTPCRMEKIYQQRTDPVAGSTATDGGLN